MSINKLNSGMSGIDVSDLTIGFFLQYAASFYSKDMIVVRGSLPYSRRDITSLPLPRAPECRLSRRPTLWMGWNPGPRCMRNGTARRWESSCRSDDDDGERDEDEHRRSEKNAW